MGTLSRLWIACQEVCRYQPAPALGWLEAFSEERFQHSDLHRFSVQPHTEVDHKLRFSLIRRPSPYT